MAKGDFQISLVKVSSQYILLDPRSFEQVVCAERMEWKILLPEEFWDGCSWRSFA